MTAEKQAKGQNQSIRSQTQIWMEVNKKNRSLHPTMLRLQDNLKKEKLEIDTKFENFKKKPG